MNGFEATRAIRALEKASPLPVAQQRLSTRLNGGLPVLAVTASLPEREKATIVEAGLGACGVSISRALN